MSPADGRDLLPGIVLVIIGLWLAAQVLLGDLPERIIAWQGYLRGAKRPPQSAPTPTPAPTPQRSGPTPQPTGSA